ncbi:MAG: phosphate ABC transporter substrate-binding protein [Deltaproteobacteria bacterium]|nr:phosphate ABC transporter substrate-binding protein [Deltaproteobacteria bacterium]
MNKFLLSLALLAPQGTKADSCPLPHSSGTVRFAGGTAHIPLIEELGQGLRKKCPGLRFLLAGGGSGVGVQKLSAGLVDIANTGRPLSDAERKKGGLKSYPLASDAMVMIVHPSNAISDISLSELQTMFAAEPPRWPTNTNPTHIFVRDEASGTQEVFMQLVMRGKKISRQAHYTSSHGAMKLAVSRDPQAIGFLSFAYVDEQVKALSIGGTAPTRQNMVNGLYPLMRTLFVNVKETPSPLASDVISFLLGPETKALLEKHGFLPPPLG